MLTFERSMHGRHDGDDASTKMEEEESKDRNRAAAAKVYNIDIAISGCFQYITSFTQSGLMVT